MSYQIYEALHAIENKLDRIADSLERLAKPKEYTITLEPNDFTVQQPDERAEDATFEGFAEFLGNPNDYLREGEFVLPDPLTFDLGDVIPDSIHTLTNPQGDEFTWREEGMWAGFDFTDSPVGVFLPRDTTKGGWVTSDFPLTEAVDEPEQRTYSLIEASELLSQYGIDTGQRRLKDFLNTGIAWTDHFNRPRPIAAEYLEIVKQESPNRDAVVRITAEGVEELARVMRMAV